MRLLPYVAALFTLQLVLAAVTKALDAGLVSHAIAGDDSVSQHTAQ